MAFTFDQLINAFSNAPKQMYISTLLQKAKDVVSPTERHELFCLQLENDPNNHVKAIQVQFREKIVSVEIQCEEGSFVLRRGDYLYLTQEDFNDTNQLLIMSQEAFEKNYQKCSQ